MTSLAANLAALARYSVGLGAGNLVALASNGKLPPEVGAGGLKNIQVFRESRTYTPTSGVTKALVIVTGGGAGLRVTGSGSSNRTGSGAGGTAIKLVSNPAVQPVIVGSGGSSGAPGGASSFAGTVIANGGIQGVVENAMANGGAGGTATGGDVNITGGQGGDAGGGTSGSGQAQGAPGTSFWGGANAPGSAAYINHISGFDGIVVVLEYGS